MRGENVHHIQDSTHAQVVLNDDNPSKSYIEISAASEEALDDALKMAGELIDSINREYNEWLDGPREDQNKGKGKGKGGKDKSKEKGDFVATVDLGEYDEAFAFKPKFLGFKTKNLHAIQDATRCLLWLQGPESAPTHVDISGHSQADVDEAVQQCSDLIANLDKEDEQWLEDDGAEAERERKGSKGKGKDKGKDKDKGKGKHKDGGDVIRELRVKYCDPGFNMKGALIGSRGRNVQHIQDQTGCKLAVIGEAGDDNMVIELKAPNSRALEDAVQLCKGLLKTVYEEYDEWQS